MKGIEYLSEYSGHGGEELTEDPSYIATKNYVDTSLSTHNSNEKAHRNNTGPEYCRKLGLSAQITSDIFSYTWNHVPSVTGKGYEVMMVPFVFWRKKFLFSA